MAFEPKGAQRDIDFCPLAELRGDRRRNTADWLTALDVSLQNIELRNVGIMMFGDDGVSLDTDNVNIWIHNNGFFYGKPGSDADQIKGDGSIDHKYNSHYLTISYNHSYDSGKVIGNGGGTETVPTLFVTFHHNWFNHTDSRNPRLHYVTAHIYNNYYDGVAKYGVGNTTESSAFVEANYFRNNQFPMLISLQGTDVHEGDGWFSGQEGGMTKAYNNIVMGAGRLVYYQEDPGQFDAFLASSRAETVPGSVLSNEGAWAYSNFDTASTMYAYTPHAPEEVPDVVTTYAGRMNGGDLKWEFTAADDPGTDIIAGLKDAITNYSSRLVSVGN